MNKSIEKLEQIFRKYIIEISLIYILLFVFSLFLNFFFIYKINCMKEDIEKQKIIYEKYQIMQNDSIMNSIYQADKKKIESFLHAMYVEILKNKKQLKEIEDETTKIKNDYYNTVVNRPNF